MKKLILSILLMLLPILTSADSVEIDGIWYNLDHMAKKAEVTKSSNEYSGNVEIPPSVTYKDIDYIVVSIGESSFWEDRNLTSVTIPNSVTSIGDHAFQYCSSLTSVTIPDGVNSIGQNAFYGTAWYNNQPDGLVYAGKVAYNYKGEMPANTNITIKAGTLGITSYAFSDCSNLTSVTIPSSVTSIDDYAFSNCNGLTSINVESDNPQYDSRNSCNAIIETSSNTIILGCKSTTIPNSVTSIRAYAFSQCNGLTTINIPNSVTSIEDYAFTGCNGLTSIKVESDNPQYDSRNSCNAIIETSSNTLITGCKNTTIPNSVSSIGSGAFSGCTGLTSFIIPNSVTSIGISAFSNCSGLTSITIPNSVTFIGDGAFTFCSSLKSINIPNSVSTIGALAFMFCNDLSFIIFPNSVTSIGVNAFNYCSGIKDFYCWAEYVPSVDWFSDNCKYATLHVPAVSLDAYKRTAPWNKFGTIVALTENDPKPTGMQIVEIDGINYNLNADTKEASVVSPKRSSHNLDYSGDIAIPASVLYCEVSYKVTSIDGYAFGECSSLTSIDIPDNVKTIGPKAFFGCSGLTSVSVPSSVTTIEPGVFEGCSGLTSVIIPNGVTAIGANAFKDCSSLTSVIIPNGVTAIGANAFDHCSSLTSVIIPNGITTIGEKAFVYCCGLTSVTIPISVTSIGDNTFLGCNGLTSVNIPNSVISIGNWAFYECSGLTSIIIPHSVTSIGMDAFKNCSSLASIKIESDNPQYDSRNNCNAIIETSSNTLILGCKNTIIPNGVTSISNSAFYGCSGLTTINIPNSVISIDGNVFSSCNGLTSINVESDNPQYDSRNNCNAIIETATNTLIVGCKNTTIPNSVVSIGRDAFCGCSDLTSITIPNSVTLIGGRAFYLCYSLIDISIPNSVTSIDNMAFQHCHSLTSITIPNSVSRIGGGAFMYCWNLRDIYYWAEDVPYIEDSTFESSLYIAATLHVPAVSVDAYKQTYPWSKFINTVPLTDDDPKPTGIQSLKTNDNIYPVDIYSIDGKRKSQPQRGLNIIRMSNGTTKKIIKQ